jgi:O-acetyl-ADP-ribose deacetylase (regulator of RNase III)
MIEFKQGNIVESDAEAVVNTVNCLGVSGAGIALQFKKVFPDNYKAYRKHCEDQLLKPGHLFVYIQHRGSLGDLTIVNFATKDNWRNDSSMEWIKSGLEELRKLIIDLQLCSVSMPKLGCGNGGLDYNDVKPLIVEFADSLPKVRVVVYE